MADLLINWQNPAADSSMPHDTSAETIANIIFVIYDIELVYTQIFRQIEE